MDAKEVSDILTGKQPSSRRGFLRAAFIGGSVLLLSSCAGKEINRNEGVPVPLKGENRTAEEMFNEKMAKMQAKIDKLQDQNVGYAFLLFDLDERYVEKRVDGKRIAIGYITNKSVDAGTNETRATYKIRLFARRVPVDQITSDIPIVPQPCFTLAEAYKMRAELDKIEAVLEPMHKWSRTKEEAAKANQEATAQQMPEQDKANVAAMGQIVQEKTKEADQKSIELDPVMGISQKEIDAFYNRLSNSSFFRRPKVNTPAPTTNVKANTPQ